MRYFCFAKEYLRIIIHFMFSLLVQYSFIILFNSAYGRFAGVARLLEHPDHIFVN